MHRLILIKNVAALPRFQAQQPIVERLASSSRREQAFARFNMSFRRMSG
jgi:hypothetical protein